MFLEKPTNNQMTPSQLKTIGKRLYGETWITPMAKALDHLHVSTVYRWAEGQTRITPRAERQIKALK